MERPEETVGLADLLKQLQEQLEELEEEQRFTLSQTGLHVTGGTRKKFEAGLAALRERIRTVEAELAAKRGS